MGLMSPSAPEATTSLLSFLAASPSPFHAVEEAATRLAAAGFDEVDPARPWPGGAGHRYLRRGGALLAWVVPPGAGPATPFRIVGAHTDSPGLRVKPRPDVGAAGWKQLGVEVYGGPLLNSWLDRDLGVAGRLVTTSGDGLREVLVRLDEPVCRVPQLAVHLDRGVNEDGLRLDRQRHLVPVWGLGAPRPGEFAAVLADAADVDPASIAGWELALFDLTPPRLLGLAEEFLASARIDNQFSCWAAVSALVAVADTGAAYTGAAATGAADVGAPDAGAPATGAADIGAPDAGRQIAVAALFDHEEVGSDSATGAAGPLLPDLLERIVLAAGGTREDLARACASSVLVSADMAHAVHPNYAERSEPAHAPLPNGGPVIKVNANQRYATDARSAAAFAATCDRAGVPHQVFVSNTSLACGSTIGPALATRLGISTVDVGCAQLSMHSARELAGAADAGHLAAALTAFYAAG